MQFDSFAAFIEMGGYGAYVWAVYLIGVVILLANVLRPRQLLKRFFQQQLDARKLQETQERQES